ncbi:MAG: C-type lectin domain-containing protein, partial [Phycisphaerales bacterium]
MLRAARTVGRTQVARRTGVAAIALLATFAASAAISTEFSGFHHAGAPSAFLTPRGEIVRPRDGTPHEEMKMRGFNGVMAGAALALSSSVLAQDAVQWRVEDGGNGHWYVRDSTVGTWDQANLSAIQANGTLASVTHPEENSTVAQLMSANLDCWIGARKLTGEPWQWIDGTPWTYTNWCPGEPCCFDNGLYVFMVFGGCWDDHNQVATLRRGVIEFSA